MLVMLVQLECYAVGGLSFLYVFSFFTENVFSFEEANFSCSLCSCSSIHFYWTVRLKFRGSFTGKWQIHYKHSVAFFTLVYQMRNL
jgi:hypothetical protein